MAREFDGSTGYLQGGSGTPNEFTPLAGSAGPWTLALWFKASNLTQTNTYLLNINNSGLAVLWEYVNNTIEAFSAGYTGDDPRTDSGIVVGDTNWHHIVYRKAASGSSAWDKFLDGTKTSINASIAFTFKGQDVNCVMSVGGSVQYSGDVLTNPAAVHIAELAIWESSVSDGDITTLAGGVRADTIGTPSYYWRLLGNDSPEPEEMGTGKTLAINGTVTQSTHPFTDGQFARPAADRADGNWLNESSSNVNLYASIDEETANDADYIRSGAAPTNDTCTVDLSAISTPVAGTVTMRIRARFL